LNQVFVRVIEYQDLVPNDVFHLSIQAVAADVEGVPLERYCAMSNEVLNPGALRKR
jgi:hypothetical protein